MLFRSVSQSRYYKTIPVGSKKGMRVKSTLQIIVMLFCFTSTIADSWDQVGQKFKDFGNGIANQAQNLIEGFESMGGAVPASYVYSFRVFNGTQSDLTVRTRNAKKIMGARIDGDTKDSMLIHPGYRDWETDRKSTRLNSSH